ncbi:MAG: carboxy terminal-processing peptidase [Thermodesulfobacteriota bacterium]|nr:carboxy terminal-processing peptidase [Thermodesulfobacteriota bacterium]
MKKKKFIIACTGLLVILFFTISFSLSKPEHAGKTSLQKKVSQKASPPGKVTYNSEDSATCINIIKSLEKHHYSEKRLDDFLSSIIFTRYITTLDPSKHLFIQDDIKEFEQIKYRIDNSLKKGNLSPGYKIFNVYLERSFQRLIWIQEHIENWEQKFDFTKNEFICLNREDEPWPADEDELFQLWHKELKNTILTLKLEDESNDEITKTIKKRYASRLNRLSQTNSKDTFRTYINAVTMSFDPHTQYFPPRASEDFDIQMSLSLEGIGAVLQSDYEYTKVVRLIPAGPADKSAMLMPGDKIIGVGQNLDGKIQDVVGWRIDEVVKLIRGPKDSIVKLAIIPADKKGEQNSKTIHIKRDKVKLEEQAAHKKIVTLTINNHTYKIGVIDIPAFYLDFQALQAGKQNYKSTTRDVRSLLKELDQENIDGLIIDLRDNGGGALQEANKLAGLFIESGPTVQIRSRNGYISRLKDPDPNIVYNGPLMVMINRMSASASEIFAGAIKDYNRGIIVGTRSFGKGTVQGLQPISKGQLKLTSAKFYRVSGKSTQNSGVLPDLEYPHIYNSKETGENSLQGALPWDKTRQAFFKPYKKLSTVSAELSEKHIKRKKNNPDFKYLSGKFQFAAEIYKIKSWSINEKKRRQQKKEIEKKEIEIENLRLTARGLDPISSIEELRDNRDNKDNKDNKDKNKHKNKHKNNKDEDEDEDEDEDDFLLKETEFVMADFISITEDNGYQW